MKNLDDFLRPVRKQPAIVEAEQAVIGSIFLNDSVFDKISHFLEPEHFAVGVNATLYAACKTLVNRGERPDAIIIKAYLGEHDLLDDVGGVKYLMQLADLGTKVIHAKEYAIHIVMAWAKREWIKLCQESEDKTYDPTVENLPMVELDRFQGRIGEINAALERCTEQAVDGIDATIAIIEEAYKTDGASAGVKTGFHDVDDKLIGMAPGDLVILAARPSVGKTALSMDIAFNIARRIKREDADKPDKDRRQVVFFSLEMKEPQFRLRMISEMTNIPFTDVRYGRVNMQHIIEAGNEMRELPLTIIDKNGMTAATIHSKCRDLARSHPIELVFVDHIRFVNPVDPRIPRAQSLGRVVFDLKTIGKIMDFPIIALCQLNRSGERLDNKRPDLSALRDSGEIEENADTVLFIHREAYYLERFKPDENAPMDERSEWMSKWAKWEHVAEILISKNRQGPIGSARLFFDGKFTRFTNLER